GVLCRVMVEGGRPLMFIGLPLVADTSEFEFLRDNLREVFGQVAQAQGWSRADAAQPLSAGRPPRIDAEDPRTKVRGSSSSDRRQPRNTVDERRSYHRASCSPALSTWSRISARAVS